MVWCAYENVEGGFYGIVQAGGRSGGPGRRGAGDRGGYKAWGGGAGGVVFCTGGDFLRALPCF